MHLPKPTECTLPRINSNVYYGLEVIMMYQCKFINCNERSSLEGGVANGGGCACVGVGGIWENSVPSNPFVANIKLLLKKKV